ncbi:MAG: hypothetical protein WEB02_01805 [Methylophaga sp.]
MKTSQDLDQAGYTTSGIARYEQTVEEYADTLHNKALKFGELNKAPDLPIEITHDNVRAAAYQIANTYGKNKTSHWAIISQVTEYILTAISAYALGKTSESWGLPLFVIAAIIAGILIAIRLSKSK